MEYFLDKQIWVSAIAGSLVMMLIQISLKKIYPYFYKYKQQFSLLAGGFFRKVKLDNIKRVRRIRFNSILIQREMFRSYVFLILFGLFSSLGFFSFALQRLAEEAYILFWIFITISIVFEVGWIIKSADVDEYIKFRSKINNKKMR